VREVTQAVYAGLDLGTPGFEGVLAAADGRIVARAAAQHPTHRPEPGAAEQHPEDWLKAFTSVTLGLAKAVAAERWRAVGLSGMLPTLLLTDGVGAAATPGGIDAPYGAVPSSRWAPPSPGRTAAPRRRGAPSGERAGVAPDHSRSAWWESQAERHESAVAGQIVRR
jgi:hypothetical protein